MVVVKTEPIKNVRFGFCLTSPTQNNVFIIGGLGKRVSRYSITEDKWNLMPELNVGRFYCSACSISGHIYVIAGLDFYNNDCTNSIEKLSLNDVSKGVAAWQIMHPDKSSFSPRYHTAVVRLNAQEIAIFGGFKKMYCQNHQTDIIILNTETKKFNKVADITDSQCYILHN